MLNLTLTDEQLDQLADAVTTRINSRGTQQTMKPLTVSEFAGATGLSTCSVYRHLKAGTIRRVPNIGKKLIPGKELEKFQ